MYLINSIDLNITIEQIHQEKMQGLFIDNTQPHHQQQQFTYTPLIVAQDTNSNPIISTYSGNQFEFNYTQDATIPQPVSYTQQENEFNDFEEDQTAKRIREQEENIQRILKEKSDKEWESKQKKRQEGKRQLQEFLQSKQTQKKERASENIRRQAQLKEDYAKLNVQAGWKKVVTNINVRQGERTGAKDTNRMRQAILHKREDDKK